MKFGRLLRPDATDENWEYYGKECPYFGVVSWPKFRKDIDKEARDEFFQTGETYIGRLFGVIEGSLQTEFKPTRAMDFGCGVGRLVIPLSKRCGEVLGVDVSPSMLAEARKNCLEQACANVVWAQSLDEIAGSGGGFDFVHSFIVFQHIRPERGIPIFAALISSLKENGIGAVHLTFSNPGGRRARLLHWIFRKIPLSHGVAQMFRGRPFSEPLMDMAEYPLDRVFAILQDAGCHECNIRFTRHGVRGMTLIFRKAALAEI